MFMCVVFVHWAQLKGVGVTLHMDCDILVEGVHAGLQYLARNSGSAPPVKCLLWLKNTNN